MTPKLRVLHVIKSLGRGGAEVLLPETLKLHDHARFEFHCIYFLPWKDQMVEAIKSGGATVSLFRASSNIGILLQAWKIVRYIRETNIEIVHCHLPWAGFVGRLVFRFIKIPVVYTEHNKQERYHFLTRWLNKITFNWQSAAIPVSQDVERSMRDNIAIRIPIHQVNNGVNTTFFQHDAEGRRQVRDRYGIPTDAIVVGTVAVFRFQKRLTEWLQIFAKAASKDRNVYAIVVGDGSLRSELVEEVKRLGIGPRVIMPGLQTDVRDWLSAMDIFMMASVFEGLPIALLEAMSVGCAIVTTDAGGIKQVVLHNHSGLMVKADRWQDLEGELLRLIADPAQRLALSKEARKRVQSEFGLEQMVRKLEQLYLQYGSSSQIDDGEKRTAR